MLKRMHALRTAMKQQALPAPVATPVMAPTRLALPVPVKQFEVPWTTMPKPLEQILEHAMRDSSDQRLTG